MYIAEHAFAGEIRQRGHHATLSAAAGAARKAVALPKVRSPKSAVFGGGILQLVFQFLARAVCPLKWTLQNVSKSIVCFLDLSTFVDSCFLDSYIFQ